MSLEALKSGLRLQIDHSKSVGTTILEIAGAPTVHKPLFFPLQFWKAWFAVRRFLQSVDGLRRPAQVYSGSLYNSTAGLAPVKEKSSMSEPQTKNGTILCKGPLGASKAAIKAIGDCWGLLGLVRL